MHNQRINQQAEFLAEMDKLTQVVRRNYLSGGERRENTAEHSWHVALQAIVFAEYANEPVDVDRVVRMLLIHDVVEIQAGDTYIYDGGDPAEQEAKEAQAAAALFGLLPADQAEAFQSLWREFEHNTTPEARFAKALDRFLPVLQNYKSGGISWREHGITAQMVEGVIARIKPGSTALWEYAGHILAQAVSEGLFGK
jgi:putative hydrolase of HD superfamily